MLSKLIQILSLQNNINIERLIVAIQIDVISLKCTVFILNVIGDELLLNFGAKFQRLYHCMRNFCNLIGLEQWYFSLTWNTYMWKLQTFCG